VNFLRFVVQNPNLTILLPGGCNASCDFCFWNKQEGKILAPTNYIDKVFATIAVLPKNFSALSISGGEPTLSPWFGRFLSRLGVYRRAASCNIGRVVLTTNGVALDKHLGAVGCVVEHINISRHGISDEQNAALFGTNSIPTDAQLAKLIARIHAETSCDVTLNCVIEENCRSNFCKAFIEYAKELGADAVSFRKVASTVDPTPAEKKFVKKWGIASKSDCPVCRGLTQVVDGFDVRWKGSVVEPSITSKGIYEGVIHPDGNLYADWGMKLLIQTNTTPRRVVRKPTYVGYSGHSIGTGCSSSSSGGCASSRAVSSYSSGSRC